MSTAPVTPLTRAGSSPSESPAPSSQVVGEAWASRLRRWRPVILALAAFTVIALATALMRPSVSKTPYALDNPTQNGAQAAGALLRQEGIGTRTVRSVDETLETVSDSSTPVTIALVHAGSLSSYERSLLARSGADVTVVGSTYEDLTGLTDLTSSGLSADEAVPLSPQCDDPDALAAQSLAGTDGSITVDGGASSRPDGVVTCFPAGQTDGFAYAVAPLEGGGTLRVIADASVVTNGRLAQAGHAALSVRALGHHETLLWLDGEHNAAPMVWAPRSVPTWFSVMGLQALLALGVLAVVQGRRFGRLVEEDLPVLVRSSETTRGRARLYRLAGDRHRASRALRAGTARRIGHRLGVPASAEPATLVAAVTAATGLPERSVSQILYGPVPDSNRSLADLATQLDGLESEVSHR